MTGSAAPRRAHRRGFVAIVLLIALALVAAMASVAGAKEGPVVPGRGRRHQGGAQLAGSATSPTVALAVPVSAARAVHGAAEGWARATAARPAQGVTKDTIKVVLLLGTHEQQDTAANDARRLAPQNHATNQSAYIEESYPDWQQVLDHNFNTWGRKFEFVTVHPTGADEAAQRADALTVAEMKPFIVVSSAPCGRRVAGRCSPPTSSPRRSSCSTAASRTQKRASRRRTGTSAASTTTRP